MYTDLETDIIYNFDIPQRISSVYSKRLVKNVDLCIANTIRTSYMGFITQLHDNM